MFNRRSLAEANVHQLNHRQRSGVETVILGSPIHYHQCANYKHTNYHHRADSTGGSGFNSLEI